MKPLSLARPGEQLSLLCIGAHSDDIEIGAGATILEIIGSGVHLDVHWVVLSAEGSRADEARSSAAAFLEGATRASVEVADFRTSFFPYQGSEIKSFFEGLKSRVEPDVILTHYGNDAHQDHREVSMLTWNAFRDHIILEYEIPKWDGDLGRPNVYVSCSERTVARKAKLLEAHFGTQRSKDWFDPSTFSGLARIRGMECRASERFAEAFYARKLLLM